MKRFKNKVSNYAVCTHRPILTEIRERLFLYSEQTPAFLSHSVSYESVAGKEIKKNMLHESLFYATFSMFTVLSFCLGQSTVACCNRCLVERTHMSVLPSRPSPTCNLSYGYTSDSLRETHLTEMYPRVRDPHL